MGLHDLVRPADGAAHVLRLLPPVRHDSHTRRTGAHSRMNATLLQSRPLRLFLSFHFMHFLLHIYTQLYVYLSSSNLSSISSFLILITYI